MLQAVGKKVVIRPIKTENETKSGLILSNMEEDLNVVRGEVMSIGDRVESKNFEVGDTVHLQKNTTNTIFHEGEDFYIVEEDGVFTAVKDSTEN